MSYLSIFIVVIVLFASYWLAYTPLIISITYVFFSLLIFLLYAKDKAAAKKGMWRVSENTLHTLSLFGGWPGAIIAQQVFRHKTKKVSFRRFFWITILANVGVFVWLHTHQGIFYLRTYIFELEEFVLNEVVNSYVRIILLNLLSFHA